MQSGGGRDKFYIRNMNSYLQGGKWSGGADHATRFPVGAGTLEKAGGGGGGRSKFTWY